MGGWPSSRPPDSRRDARKHPQAGSHPRSHQMTPAKGSISDSTLMQPRTKIPPLPKPISRGEALPIAFVLVLIFHFPLAESRSLCMCRFKLLIKTLNG